MAQMLIGETVTGLAARATTMPTTA